jgi:hypothetical protein
MCINASVNNNIACGTHGRAEGRTLAFVRATWKRLHDPTRKGFRFLLAGLIAFASCGACGGGSPPPMARGSISLAWSIADLNGQPTTCDRVGATTVVLRLRSRTGAASVASFPCANSPSTAQIVAGPYDITPELHASDGTVLATAPDQTGVTVAPGQVATLTPVRFAASTNGGFVISLAAPPTTANCKSVAMGGAAITGTTITLERVAGGCAVVTFTRSRGTTQLGTYTVNCSSPQVAACIERDETLTTSLAPGSYTIRARSKIGTLDCWRSDEALEVPLPGKRLTRTLNLAHQNIPGC